MRQVWPNGIGVGCWLAAGVILAACESGPPPRYSPGELDEQRLELLRQAEVAYLADDAAYDGLRQQVAADPVAAYRWSQFVVFRMAEAERDRAGTVDESFMAAVAGEREPEVERGFAELEALGAAAVMPMVCEELFKVHRAGEGRHLGLAIVERLGAAAVPHLSPLLQSTEEAERRVGLQALGVVPAVDGAADPAVRAALVAALDDEAFTLRAMAVESLGRQPQSDAVLRRVLLEDDDSFVRRKAVEALGNQPGHENAALLIDYLQLCQQARDHRGEEAVQEALQQLAGQRLTRSVDAWRRWLEVYDGAPR